MLVNATITAATALRLLPPLPPPPSRHIAMNCRETMALFPTIKQWPKKCYWQFGGRGKLLQWRLGVVNECNLTTTTTKSEYAKHRTINKQQQRKCSIFTGLVCECMQKWMVRWFNSGTKYPLFLDCQLQSRISDHRMRSVNFTHW